jgi:hypothetical protein
VPIEFYPGIKNPEALGVEKYLSADTAAELSQTEFTEDGLAQAIRDGVLIGNYPTLPLSERALVAEFLSQRTIGKPWVRFWTEDRNVAGRSLQGIIKEDISVYLSTVAMGLTISVLGDTEVQSNDDLRKSLTMIGIDPFRSDNRLEFLGDNDIVLAFSYDEFQVPFLIISTKVSMRERVWQTTFWSIMQQIHVPTIRSIFITMDKDCELASERMYGHRVDRKNRQVLEGFMYATYTLRVEPPDSGYYSPKIQWYGRFYRSLKALVAYIEETYGPQQGN